MKEWLRNWLFPLEEEWDDPFDPVAIANDQIPKLRADVDDLFISEKDRLASAHRVWSEPIFKEVLQSLMDIQVKHSVLEANDWQRVLFDRATINGFMLVQEEFEKLEHRFQAMIRPPDEFNKMDIL